jgi:hypothetical protein
MTQIDATRGETRDALNDLIGLASRETIERQHARAAIAAQPPAVRFTRQRAYLVGLGLSVPMLLIVLVTNVLGISLVDMMTPSPTPEVARQPERRYVASPADER